jgi:hypothetical protein
VHRLAGFLIRQSCRRLPADTRDERYREWAAEIPAILADPGTRPAVLRPLRALGFALGIARCVRHPRLAPAAPRGWPGRSLALRAIAGAGIYLAAVALFLGIDEVVAPRGPWLVIMTVACCACLDAFCLADLARRGQVRCLPKWGWALACLAQSPFGGIMYLSVGRMPS